MILRFHRFDAKFWRKFHKFATLFWAMTIIPTLIWWKDSILWVALMSCWANMGTHWGAYQASRAEDNNGNPTES